MFSVEFKRCKTNPADKTVDQKNCDLLKILRYHPFYCSPSIMSTTGLLLTFAKVGVNPYA
jgi:hypothetical protein